MPRYSMPSQDWLACFGIFHSQQTHMLPYQKHSKQTQSGGQRCQRPSYHEATLIDLLFQVLYLSVQIHLAGWEQQEWGKHGKTRATAIFQLIKNKLKHVHSCDSCDSCDFGMPRCLFGKAVIVQLHLVMAMKAIGGQLLLQVCDGGNHAVHLLREVTEKSLRSPECFLITLNFKYFLMCLTYSYVFNVFAHAYDQPRAGQENPPTEENLGV